MEKHIIGKKYKWEIIDKYGWQVDIKDLRRIKLENLKGEKSFINKFKFTLSIDTDSLDSMDVFYEKNINTLTIKDLKFFCKDIINAESLVDSVCLGNNFKVFPRYLK